MVLQIGMNLPRLVLRWAADAEQAFSIGWKDSDGEPLDLTDTTVRLLINGSVTLDATNSVGGFSNWTIAAADSEASYIGLPVRLEFVIDGDVYLMSQGTVRAA
jgi:hypothetical protein